MAYKNKDKEKENWAKWRKIKKLQSVGVFDKTYEELLDIQNGVCAICEQPENTNYKRSLSIDHDHITGKFRGLLCHMCNTGLGKFFDNPELLIAATNYLKETN